MSWDQIAISDTEAALLWTNQVEHEIEETHDLLDECGKTVQAIKDDADGTLIDELYRYGADFLKFASDISGAMKVVSNGIRSFINKIKNAFI